MLLRSLYDHTPHQTKRLRWRVGLWCGVYVLLTLAILSGLLVKDHIYTTYISPPIAIEPATEVPDFPIGVRPATKEITENPAVSEYVTKHLSIDIQEPRTITWLDHLTAKLALQPWYQQMATPLSRILVILPGERKEEVVSHFQSVMNWSDVETAQFLAAVTAQNPALAEGTFFPDRYVVSADSSPEAVATLINERFTHHVLNRYETASAELPIETALIIASLLEREAYDFNDMRYISGVIWNRLFIDMKLQLDATLQYANANIPSTQSWWPVVHPRDKYIPSPYNTYENEGLPPAPIANPSVAAIIAALNPRETECIFYFHDDNADFHCSPTYEEHVDKLKAIYGQGR